MYGLFEEGIEETTLLRYLLPISVHVRVDDKTKEKSTWQRDWISMLGLIRFWNILSSFFFTWGETVS
jgi:hypothetical protein